MTLRTKTVSAALALAISAAGMALAQDAVTPAPATNPAPAQQPTEAPTAPAEPGSGVSPTGETADAPTQSSEPTSVPAAGEQTPMEAPGTPSVTATDADAPAEPSADAAAEEPAAPAADAGAVTAPAAEPAAGEQAAEAPAEGAEGPAEGAEAPAESDAAGEPAGNAVQVTEGDEAAIPAETTGTVVAEEGSDDIEGAAAENEEGGEEGEAHIEDIAFSFEGPFGKYDQFQLQRGLQVYTEVCAACHGMKFVPLRTLSDEGGPGLPEDQVRAYAANLTPILDPETGEERPRVPTDHFPTVTGDGMGPDLSLMAKARAAFHGPYGTGISQFVNGIGGPEYINAILTSYTGEEVEQAGSVLYENTAFPGGLIAMPAPLSDDLVTYEDGTPATAHQMARDVAAFLMWTAEPKLSDRKQVGLVAVLLLIVLTSLLYLTNKRLWKPHKGKPLHR
ncbi:cytochrome c1 [Paracoccus sediminis]|uniref:Cytochrome c1 n=1 Tax=Paracoccus sediminis TaxID=1214787 RepID=A0A238VDE9_9RHOB|nr:cytochrome c1 [Paracoccus sediminis]SNR32425.1 ubiquinol-cytochrome c reductase cytochrome c1 subunit [Paracoccus sediminis]